MNRVVVVGGGIIGTMHAWMAIEAGHHVVQLERESEARGASVRNFGMVWVSGRRTGRELQLALRARELWGRIGAACPGTGFRASGSLTLLRTREELDLAEEAYQRADAQSRGWLLMTRAEVTQSYPQLEGEFLGGLFCERDALVEPRLVLPELRRAMARSERYEWLPGHQAMDRREHAVQDQAGRWHEGDLVIICPGAAHLGIGAEVMAKQPLRRVRIQMLATSPLERSLPMALADGDSLRYYPAYEGGARARLPEQDELGAAWRLQLLLAQRLDGTLTIGDTHSYQEPFPFDCAEAPLRQLLEVAETLIGVQLPPVTHRWAGVYSQLDAEDGAIYLRANLAPGVFLITGPGGRGMTLSPAIAEETFA